MCLTDQHTGFAEVLCLRTRDEAPLAVQTIILRWINQLQGFSFKCLRSDRAKEFIVKWFEDWLSSVGAVHELSLAYTAKQNATVRGITGYFSL
jgi:transposase InsO family protein